VEVLLYLKIQFSDRLLVDKAVDKAKNKTTLKEVSLMSEKAEKDLQWTGERYLPWMEIGEIHYEHLHRYNFASQFVHSKTVLDLACGEGYGSALLSESASKVVGVDIDKKTILHAKKSYKKTNLEFKIGSITEIPILGNEKFDVIVCFEAIEHIEDHKKLLLEVKRLLKTNGLFIVSTPNKLTYTKLSTEKNPFHKKELYLHELQSLLHKNFKEVKIYGQSLFLTSNIWLTESHTDNYDEFLIEKQTHGFGKSSLKRKIPNFFVSICSNGILPANTEKTSVLLDTGNSLLVAKHEIIKKLEGLI